MKKYYKIIITIFLSLLALSSCGTLSSHNKTDYQNISVASLLNGDDNVQADCNITHNNFTYYKAAAPFSMRVRRSHYPIYINCNYNGFSSGNIKILSIDAHQYSKDHTAKTTTRWKNEHHRPKWVYPAMIHIPLNDFNNFYTHTHFYPDKTVPAGIFLSRNAGKIL